MPFKSKSQARACYAILARNPKSKWKCSEWSKETDWKHLPERLNRSPKNMNKSYRKSIRKSKRKTVIKRK